MSSLPVGRFVLRYRGEGDKPEAEVERFRRLQGTTVLDEASPSMLLVEAPEEPLAELVRSLTDWLMAPDQSFVVPDTRRRTSGIVPESQLS